MAELRETHDCPAEPGGRAIMAPAGMAVFAFGWLCVGLGALGVVLPLLPTTPFLLLALWAFSRSSPRFKSWLWNHSVLGPYVRDWVAYHVIPPKAKILAAFTMSASMFWVIAYTTMPPWAIGLAGVVMAGAAGFVLSRPSQCPNGETP